MVLSRRAGKWVALCLLAAVALVAVLGFTTRSQYPFIESLGGELRSSSQDSGDIRAYSFTKAYQDVLTAVRSGLKEQGWNCVYEDPHLALFTRKGEAHRAILAKRTTEWRQHEDPKTTCALWIPMKVSWLEEKIGSLIHKSMGKAGAKTLHATPPDDTFAFSIDDATSGPVQVVWRNLGKAEGTAEITMFDLNNYEPTGEALPLEFTVPPNGHRVELLRYPPEATATNERLYNISFEWGSPANLESTSLAYGTQPEPEVGAEVRGGKHILKITNSSEDRTFQIRRLKVTAGRRVLADLAGPRELATGETLEIPIKLPPKGEKRFRFEYRLLPNKGWRVMDIDEG